MYQNVRVFNVSMKRTVKHFIMKTLNFLQWKTKHGFEPLLQLHCSLHVV